MQKENGAAEPDRAFLKAAIAEAAGALDAAHAERLASLCNMKGLKKVFCDVELMRTAECFIENSLNISAAARELYMHRNTMMYRLDKIARITGLDIRRFYDAVAFRLLHCIWLKDGNK